MDLRWLFGFVLVGLSNIRNAAAYPFHNPLKLLSFCNTFVKSIDDSVKSNNSEAVIEFLDEVTGNFFMGTMNEEAILDALLNEKILSNATDVLQSIKEYKEKLLKALECDQELIKKMKKEIIDGTWNSDIYDFVKKTDLLDIDPIEEDSIIDLFKEIHSYIHELGPLESIGSSQKPLSTTLYHINAYINNIEEVFSDMEKLQIMKTYPKLLLADKHLWQDQLDSLSQYKAIFEAEQKRIINVTSKKDTKLANETVKQSEISGNEKGVSVKKLQEEIKETLNEASKSPLEEASCGLDGMKNSKINKAKTDSGVSLDEAIARIVIVKEAIVKYKASANTEYGKLIGQLLSTMWNMFDIAVHIGSEKTLETEIMKLKRKMTTEQRKAFEKKMALYNLITGKNEIELANKLDNLGTKLQKIIRKSIKNVGGQLDQMVIEL
ncbi:hypothetical protein BdWA1_000713 [Babesia duncani]|uniref:Uncharacterized protein n=1 Tax=Babesia duncani TaxID=323732 RepID=A0AAD9UQB9_9APIC|nr:hypothetical protein BdWA1_000713 [Babesia duncani]